MKNNASQTFKSTIALPTISIFESKNVSKVADNARVVDQPLQSPPLKRL